MWLKKNISIIVLSMCLVTTVLNTHFVTDYKTEWGIAMANLAAIPLLYSIVLFLTRRTIVNAIVIVIFAIELVGVLMGWNLSTNYYPYLVIVVIVLGINYYRKKWAR